MKATAKTQFKRTEVGAIPEDWETKRLGEIATVMTGFPFKSKLYSFHEGIRVVRGQNLAERSFKWDITKKWNHFTDDLRKYLLDQNVVVFAMDGLVGKNKSVVREEDLPLILAQRVAKVQANDGEYQEFINQVILSNLFLKYCEQIKTGTTISHISKNQIEDFVLPYPTRPEERQYIGKVLSDFDSRIELAQQMNKTLESVGVALFKRWFVDFEFPNLDGKPYKSNGGKFVPSELEDAPEGWNVKAFEAIAVAKRGFSYNGKEKGHSHGEFVFITLNNIMQGGGFKPRFSWITSDRLKEQHFLSENDLIIANTHFGVGGSNIGRLLGCPAIVFFPNHYTKRTGVFSHHITKIIPYDQHMKYFLYFFLKMTHKETASYRTGTSVAGLDINNFMKNRLVLVPPKSTLEAFDSIIGPLFFKLASNYKQNVVLTGVRDSLLPKLLSGKIRVPVEVR